MSTVSQLGPFSDSFSTGNFSALRKVKVTMDRYFSHRPTFTCFVQTYSYATTGKINFNRDQLNPTRIMLYTDILYVCLSARVLPNPLDLPIDRSIDQSANGSSSHFFRFTRLSLSLVT